MYLIPLPRQITAQDGLFLIDHNTAIIKGLIRTVRINPLSSLKLLYYTKL